MSLRIVGSLLNTVVGAWEEFCIAKTQSGSVRVTVSEQNPPFPLNQWPDDPQVCFQNELTEQRKMYCIYERLPALPFLSPGPFPAQGLLCLSVKNGGSEKKHFFSPPLKSGWQCKSREGARMIRSTVKEKETQEKEKRVGSAENSSLTEEFQTVAVNPSNVAVTSQY